MGSLKKPESGPEIKINLPFMIIFSIFAIFVISSSGLPGNVQFMLYFVVGWNTRRLGNMWSAFYARLKISLNNWAKRK